MRDLRPFVRRPSAWTAHDGEEVILFGVRPVDLAILHWLYAGSSGPMTIHLLALLSFLGSGWMLLCVLPAFFLSSLQRYRGRATALLAMLTATAAVVALAKAVAGRVRPCQAIASVHALGGIAPSDPSFPSGHATGSFAFAAFVFTIHRRAGWMAFAVAVLVGISRVALGVHYPSDVVAGALLGGLIGTLCGRELRRRASVPSAPPR